MRKKESEHESDQARIAHLDDLPVSDIDLDAMFPLNPDRDAILAARRIESEQRLAEIDEETQAFIQAEIAAADPGREKSEQCQARFIPGPSGSTLSQ